jgi:hypothetical protein
VDECIENNARNNSLKKFGREQSGVKVVYTKEATINVVKMSRIPRGNAHSDILIAPETRAETNCLLLLLLLPTDHGHPVME